MKLDLTPRRILQLSSLALLAAVAVFGSLACSEGNPVAPVGTILTISANPSQISVNGSSEITIVGRRADGNPLASGTEIRLSTDLGSIPAIVSTDSNGTARAILRGDGRTGPAVVMATTGNGETMAEITVQVGEGDASKPTLLVTVTPSTVQVAESASVTVIARRADGTLFGAGETVILTTTLGSLRPERPVTNSSGTASSTYTAGSRSGTATITAIVGSSEPERVEVQIQDEVAVLVLGSDTTSIPDADTTITLEAIANNAQGEGISSKIITFVSEKGRLEGGSTASTNGEGIATKRLIVSDSEVQPNDTFEVKATVTTPAGELEKVLEITVQ